MQRFLLLIFLAFATINLSAQVLLVNSPASAEGGYLFQAANFGADVTQDTIRNGELILADDMTGTASDACEALANDATEKFVLIDRGTCEFGVKCLNAEMAGAHLAIVVNNDPNGGLVTMAPGAVGDQVTIPCIFITFANGEILKAALADGPVDISFGNILFDYNLGSGDRGLSWPIHGSIPADQITEAASLPFTPAVDVTNNGEMVATGVTVNATVTHSTAGEVYNDSVTATDDLPVDSSTLVVLPDADLSGAEVGTYTISYNISSDNADESPFDNDFEQTVSITENTFAKVPMNAATGLPAITFSTTIAGGGNIEFLTGYRILNREGHLIDSIHFFVQTDAAGGLNDIAVTLLVYEWNDLNEDGSYQNDEVEVVGFNTMEFTGNVDASGWFAGSVLDLINETDGVVVSGPDKSYVIGTRYAGTELVRFGFNGAYDFNQALNVLGTVQSDLERPYLGSQTNDGLKADFEDLFVFTDFDSPTTTAIHVADPTSTEEILPEGAANITMYPNPVSDVLTVKVELETMTQEFEYRISDINGRLIQTIEKGQVQNDVSRLDVSQLPAGQYILTAVTDRGVATKTFIVQ